MLLHLPQPQHNEVEIEDGGIPQQHGGGSLPLIHHTPMLLRLPSHTTHGGDRVPYLNIVKADISIDSPCVCTPSCASTYNTTRWRLRTTACLDDMEVNLHLDLLCSLAPSSTLAHNTMRWRSTVTARDSSPHPSTFAHVRYRSHCIDISLAILEARE